MSDLVDDPVLARWPGLAPVLSTVQARRERDEATAAAILAYLEGTSFVAEVDLRL
jgi:hypothetical protein